MKLIPNAAKVAKGASSMWLIYGSLALQLADQVLPQMAGVLPWYVPALVTAGAAVARVVKQETLHHG